MALLEASGIGKNFGETKVLKDISLTLEQGEALAIIGSSGSGKTTLLRCLNFLERPDTGVIRVNGETMWDAADPATQRESEVRKKRLHFGLVFQNFNLFPQYTALENVMLAGELLAKEQPDYKANKKAIHAQLEAQARDLLAQMGLSERAGHYPHQLSGGQQQRVAIARALALHPDILCFDEPTSALDVTVQKRILDLLDILRRESGTAVLFVTHDLALAAERADRIMVFRQGEIQEQGATETIVQRPQHPYTRQLLHDLLDAPLGLAAARHRPLATPAIRVEGISKRFSLGKQALQALDSVSFEVRRGTTHALVGESGSGKTTLARILLGFERADAGQVTIDGIDAGHLSREAQRQLRRKIQFAKPLTRVTIDANLNYYVAFGNQREKQVSFEEITPFLQDSYAKEPEMFVALYADETVPYKEIVRILNIANQNKFKMVLATRPNS